MVVLLLHLVKMVYYHIIKLIITNLVSTSPASLPESASRRVGSASSSSSCPASHS